MAELFLYALESRAQLFFLHVIKPSDAYAIIRHTILEKYHTDACQLQVDGCLSQLRLRHFMPEENITDVNKYLKMLVTRIEEIIPQCHIDFHSDRYKIRYL